MDCGRYCSTLLRRTPLSRLLTVLGVAVALVGALPVAAQDLTFTGQVRPRFEVRDPTGATGTQQWTSARTRIGVRALLENNVWAFVQLQDVRLWGEETGTLSDGAADGFDLHQGFLQIGQDDSPRSLRAGRFEQNYGGQRLIGAVDWAQQAQAFDGVRGRLNTENGWQLDGFAFQLSESFAPSATTDRTLLGSWITHTRENGALVDVYALRLDERAAGIDNDLITLGARHVGKVGEFDYRAEGSFQTGDRGSQDVSAWMFGARLGRAFDGGRVRITGWFDQLSATDPDGTDDGAFDTLFGTNHKFYGFADLFLNPRVQTGGRGLRDAAIKTSFRLADDWTLGADLHRLSVVEDRALPTSTLGDELDLTLTHPISRGLTATGGYSWVRAGDALGPVRGINQNVSFGYLMLNLHF